MSKIDINIIKIQAYFLSATNDEHRNMLHLACYRGSLELVKFIHNNAGPDYLNMLDFIINVEDDMERTPLYVLCVKGFNQKFDYKKQKQKGERKQIIKLLIPPIKE